MVVHNVSNITGEEAYNSLLQGAKRNLNKNYIYLGLGLCLGVPVMVVGLVEKNALTISMGAIVTAFLLAIAVFIVVMLIRIPKDIKKKNKAVVENGVSYDYQFKEKSCDIIVSNNGKKKKLSYIYLDFKKIFEYEDYFEIRLVSKEVMLVKKEGFTEEKEKMIEFFKKNLSSNQKLKIVNKIKTK
jgi:hypothetical protein